MKAYRSLIDECLANECLAGHWCILKELITASQKFDPRFLVQMKCVELYRWNMGKLCNRSVSWDEALNSWSSTGYAAKFADVYTAFPDINPIDLYDKVTA